VYVALQGVFSHNNALLVRIESHLNEMFLRSLLLALLQLDMSFFREPVFHEIHQCPIDVRSIRYQHNRCPTHRTMSLAAFLHLDQTPYAKQMSAAKSNRLERNIGADDARVVVYVRDDGDEGFAEDLHEDARKEEPFECGMSAISREK